MPAKAIRTSCLLIVILGSLAFAGRAIAGGGGENMLLVVNPNDPASLQIANAYAALRDIPSNNVLFIAPPADYQNNGQPISQADVTNTYLTPIAAAIAARGLTNQINYIGTIGQATCYSIASQPTTPSTDANSLNYALDLLTPLTNGSGLTLQNATYDYPSGPTSALYQDPYSIPIGDNPAILHSATYSVSYSGSNLATQYYMSGTIGYTGYNGNTATQVIASLQNGAAADGSHPQGTIYFEDNSDIRSAAREFQWPATEAQLTARGISWVYQYGTSGATPLDCSSGTAAVLGAVCGSPTPTLPNGSTYLPGAWADNLTSYGCDFPDTSQTKATAFIAAGAAGTTGSVVEPYAIAQRFTNSSIYTFIADGSTFGEAFAKSVAAPDIQMPLGDMLAQPFADVPNVSFTSGPSSYGPAMGSLSISASAGLVNPQIATGISTLELLVDGLVDSSYTAAGGYPLVGAGRGTFNLDTAGLSNGVHEVRIVAINNSQAASEGYAAQQIVVDNHGRAITFNGGNLTLSSSAATIGLAETAGDGTLSHVELTCLGRAVSQGSGSPGSLSLSPTALAPGDNVIVPVAVFSDGMQVAGGAFVVHVETGPVNGWSNGAGSGQWSNSANWSGGVLPQNGDGVARFGGGTSGGTVTLDASACVEEIDFDNSGGGGYTLIAAPGQMLTLSSTNGAASECLINVLAGSHTISAPLVLAAPGNLVNVTNPADCLTICAGVSGSGALTKTGFGLLLLANSSVYGGATTVSAGTIQLGAGGSLPSGTAATINGTLDLNVYDATIGVLAGFGTVDHSGTGGNTLTVSSGVFAGTIKNTGGTLALLKTGNGQLILSGSNTYTGGTIVSGGMLLAASTVSLSGYNQPNNVSVTAGAVLTIEPGGSSGWGNTQIAALLGSVNWSDSTAAFGIDTTGGDFAYGGNLTLPVRLIKLGANTLTLTGSNTFSGVTAIDGGTLSLGSPQALGGGNITFGGGTLQFTSSNTADYSAQFVGSTAAAIRIDTNGQAVNFNHSIASSNTAGLIKTDNGMLTLGGSNSYTGGTTVSGGTLVAANDFALSSGPVVLAPSSGTATLAFTSAMPSIGSLAGSASSVVVLGNATAFPSSPTLLVVGGDNTSTTFSGAIGDLSSTAPAAVGFLTKAGSGILTLTGLNTYSGATTVAAGALSVAGTASLPGYNLSNKVGVAGGAVLAVQLGNGTTGWSSSQITNLLTDVNWANSTAAFGIDTTNGNATDSGNLTLPVGLTKLGADALVLTGSNNCSGVVTVSCGTLSIGDGSTLGAALTSPSASVGGAATLEFNLPDSLSYGGAINGLGQLLKTGGGQLTLTGNNSYSGATRVSGGVLLIAGSAALSAASSLVASGGTLDLGGNTCKQTGAAISVVGGVVRDGNLFYNGTYSFVPGNGATATVSANLGGSAGLNMTGGGTLLLTGVNTYSGGTSVTAGVLEATTTASLPGYNTANAVSVAGGAVLAVQTSGGTTSGWNATQINSLLISTSWSTSTPNDAPNLGIDTNNGDFTYGGGIPQAIGLTKLGANNLTVTAANSVHGNLVSAGPGTLAISNNLAFGGVDGNDNPLGIVQIHQGQISLVSGGALTNLSEIDVGDTPLQTGTLALSSGTALVPYASIYYSGVNVGYNGGTGILNLTGTSLLDATATNGAGYNVVDIGFDNNHSTASAGTVTVAGNSTLRAVSGSAIVVGDGGTGALAISQSGLVETSYFQLGSQLQSGAAGGTGTLRLNGGTLSVPQVQNAGGTTGILYFNGGTLQAAASSSDFLQSSGGGTLLAYIQSGGAVVDTSGHDIAINLPLEHDPGLGSTPDGGLTVEGNGLLILSASNNYSGGTNVEAGILEVTSPSALPRGTSLTVGADATLIFEPLAQGSAAQGGPVAGDVQTVPEPSTFALLGVAAIALLGASQFKTT